MRLRLFEFSVNIRNCVAGIPKKLWNKRVCGNEFTKEFLADRLKIRSDLTVYNREIDPTGNEHSVNNSEKYNKTYSKAWLKTFGSYPIQVRKDFFIGKNFGNSLIKMLFPLPIFMKTSFEKFSAGVSFSDSFV